MSPPTPEAVAWERFKQWIEDAQGALDGCVPVALIAMRASVDEQGNIDVQLHADGRIIWPKTFPVEARGPLLEQLARPYRLGKVTR